MSSANEITEPVTIDDMVSSKIPWTESNRRWVTAIEMMASDAGVSVARFCRYIEVSPRTVALRKGNHRGKRGISFSDVDALRKIGVNDKLFSDKRVDDIRKYLPETPIKMPKVKRRSRQTESDEIARLDAKVTRLESKFDMILERLGVNIGSTAKSTTDSPVKK